MKYSPKYDNKGTCFSPDEIERMRAGLKDDLIGNSILLMVGGGLRPGEIMALRGSDISLDGARISVIKSTHPGSGKHGVFPAKLCREIVLSEDFRSYAIRLRQGNENDFIWRSPSGSEIVSYTQFRSEYFEALKAVGGVSLLTPHACRSTFIKVIARRGEGKAPRK